MPGTFFFLHGTGEQDHAANRAQVEAGLASQPALADFAYVPINWGALGPKDRSTIPALPASQRPKVRDLGADPIEADPFDADPFEAVAEELARERALATAVPGPIVDWGLKALTSAIAKHRAGVTEATADFLRNAVCYLRRGDEMRDYVARRLAAVDPDHPVVIAGHSLGSVVAFDVLSDPGRTPSRLDLFVSAGSQIPMLYLMDSLTHVRPGADTAPPPAPWLNIANPRDPISFVAAEVFAGAPTPPRDALVETPRDLPDVHSGYFSNDRVYALIADALAASGS